MRCLWEISIRSPLRETFQRPLRNISKDVFFVTSLRYLKYMSKKMSFFFFKDVFKTSQKHLSQVCFVFQKYVTKTISCDLRRTITISHKIDVGPSETLKKWNVSWEQGIDISQVCPVGLASQRSSKPNSKCIIYYFQSFFSTDKTTVELLIMVTSAQQPPPDLRSFKKVHEEF